MIAPGGCKKSAYIYKGDQEKLDFENYYYSVLARNTQHQMVNPSTTPTWTYQLYRLLKQFLQNIVEIVFDLPALPLAACATPTASTTVTLRVTLQHIFSLEKDYCYLASLLCPSCFR